MSSSGDCSRIAQVRAILDAVKLSTRVMGDDRVISCMNAVKSVECVLKKAQSNSENHGRTYIHKLRRTMKRCKCVEMFRDVSFGHGNLTSGLWSCSPSFRGCAGSHQGIGARMTQRKRSKQSIEG